MLRLIINADDLGYSTAVNSAIFRWIEAGKVTSATLMANAPGLDDALRRVRDFPQASFGVHLNIEEFAPLTGNPDLAPLVDADGSFARRTRTVRRTARLLRAIYGEWCAQIERVQAGGVQVSHIDSHHHSHNLPEMLPVVGALRRRFGIRHARITMNLFEPTERKSPRTLLLKTLYNGALRYFCGYRTTAAFTYLRTAFALDPERLGQCGTVELMSHPGHPRYEDETALLATLERLPPHRLISYRELS